MELLKVAVQFVHVIVWPVFAVFAVLVFRGPISELLRNPGQTSLKLPGGFELNVTQVAASAAAAGAALGKQSAETNQPVTEAAVQNIAAAFAGSPRHQGRALSAGRILWVDDRPAGNIELINAFQNLGIRVFQTTSTEDAEQMLQHGNHDVIISDMSPLRTWRREKHC